MKNDGDQFTTCVCGHQRRYHEGEEMDGRCRTDAPSGPCECAEFRMGPAEPDKCRHESVNGPTGTCNDCGALMYPDDDGDSYDEDEEDAEEGGPGILWDAQPIEPYSIETCAVGGGG